MRNFALVFMMFFLGCSHNHCDDQFKESEVIQISKSIISFIKRDETDSKIPFSSTLHRINIRTDFQTQKNGTGEVRMSKSTVKKDAEIFIEKVLSAKIKDEFFFRKSDSLHLVNQNCQRKFTLPDKIFNSYKFVKQEDLKDSPEHIAISFPIFSSDNKKAYVQLDFHRRDHSFGNSIYLQKIGKDWKVIEVQNLWDN